MSDPKESATGAVVKSIEPILHDLARPPAQEIGSGLAKAVRFALSPIHAAAWTYDQAAAFAQEHVVEILARRGVREEKIREAPPEIAGQAVHMLRFPQQDDDLRQMYLNLLATSMTVDGNAHPAFVDIIKNLSPIEARYIRRFAFDAMVPEQPLITIELQNEEGGVLDGVNNLVLADGAAGPDQVFMPFWAVNNLDRLKIIEIHLVELSDVDDIYEMMSTHPIVDVHINNHLKTWPGHHQRIVTRGYAAASYFGNRFARACADGERIARDAKAIERRLKLVEN